MSRHFIDEEPWLNVVRQGDFSALPDPLTYHQARHISHLINGYKSKFLKRRSQSSAPIQQHEVSSWTRKEADKAKSQSAFR